MVFCCKPHVIAFGSGEPQVTFRNPVMYGIDIILKALVLIIISEQQHVSSALYSTSFESTDKLDVADVNEEMQVLLFSILCTRSYCQVLEKTKLEFQVVKVTPP